MGITCGSQNIIVAEKNLADAEQAAINRIIALRRLYVPDMPACVRVVTVDPQGAIVAPKADDPSRRAHSLEVNTASDIPVWKTITLGTYRDVNALREHLDSRHCGLDKTADGIRDRAARVRGTMTPLQCALGDSAAELIGRPAFTLSKTRTEVTLVVLSVSELGFKDEGATMKEIYARAQQLGLELCPAEVGPQLRLQYLDQPLGEFLHIAMKPIATYSARPCRSDRSQRRRIALAGWRRWALRVDPATQTPASCSFAPRGLPSRALHLEDAVDIAGGAITRAPHRAA